MAKQNHYTSLGLEPTADAAAIKSAFRKLAMQHHPDHGGDEVEFKKITEAYKVLSDPQKRASYDRFGQYYDAAGNDNAKNEKARAAAESLEKLLKTLGENADSFNQPERIKKRFLATFKLANGIATNSSFRNCTIILGTSIAIFTLKPEYDEIYFKALAALGAGLATYASARVAVFGAAAGAVAGSAVIGNAAKLSTMFMKSASNNRKNIITVAGLTLGILSGSAVGAYEVFSRTNDVIVDLIEHPAKIQKGIEILRSPGGREELIDKYTPNFQSFNPR